MTRTPRYLLLALVTLFACSSNPDPEPNDSCLAAAATPAVASAIASLHSNRDFVCVGQRREDVLTTIANADEQLLLQILANRDGVLPWNACSWLPSAHGEASRGDYPVAGDPPAAAAAIVVGAFRCEGASANVDVSAFDSINNIVVESGYLCEFSSDGDGGWTVDACMLSWTS